jgi:hypothetical protein
MAPRKTRDIAASLTRKGFQRSERDHAFFTYHRASDQKKTSVFTKTSHGATEIDNFLIGKMATQCQLSRSEFLDLVDCTIDQIAYEAILRGKEFDV